jgi:RNA polymerase sigma factor (TIGR02999 family)
MIWWVSLCTAYDERTFDVDGIAAAGAGIFHMRGSRVTGELWFDNDVGNTTASSTCASWRGSRPASGGGEAACYSRCGVFVRVDSRSQVTELVAGLGQSEGRVSPEDLLPAVYDHLRRLAGAYMRSETADSTLQPTAVVHEAYLRLVDQSRVSWRGTTHFFAVGARAMRRVLVDHARRRGAIKRGGGLARVTLCDAIEPFSTGLDPEELLSLDAAIEELAGLDPRAARVVTLRFFGGLTMEQVAAVLEVSKRTAEGDWRHARAWLRHRLSGEPER